jgi:hypothetical protein
MRRHLFLVGAAFVLVACSSGSSTPGHSSAPSPTKPPLTATTAKTATAAGILTKADLPGYEAEKQTPDPSDLAAERALRTCLGVSSTDYLARNYGTAFTLGNLEIDSSADAVATVVEAKGDLRALSGSQAPTCFKQTFETALRGSGATVDSAAITPVPATVVGSDGAFAYRIAMGLSGNGQHVQLTGYEVGALVGQVEIDVSIEAEGSTTFTLQQALDLTAKAVTRVHTAV